MQLHLICNGMMLFWYRPAKDGRPDGYRILIPQSPVEAGMQQHELRFGASIGAPETVLCYAKEQEPTRFFELQFGYGPSLKTRCMKSEEDNVLVYGTEECKAQPSYSHDGKPAGVAFAIDIPYPDMEEGARYETFNSPPYMATGCCVQDFNIRPTRIPRCNVYTFGIVNPELPVVLQNKHHDHDRRILVRNPIEADVKLYLYSGPPHCMPKMASHLPKFNEMLMYKGQPLDLTRDPSSKCGCTPLKTIIPPAGVTRHDLRNLAEINDKIELCNCPDSARATAPADNRFTDPAECVQGGGC